MQRMLINELIIIIIKKNKKINILLRCDIK